MFVVRTRSQFGGPYGLYLSILTISGAEDLNRFISGIVNLYRISYAFILGVQMVILIVSS